jgi:flavin reductase (NADH)
MTPHHTTIPMPTPRTDADSFRETMRFMVSPVSIVTALDDQSYPRGLTCSALCSLSMAPPSLLICVNRRNRSLDAIRHSGGFMVNLLKAGRTETSDIFASSLPTKFANTEWRPSPISGLPLLSDDALAYVDCGLQAEIDTGSHAILVGLVRQVDKPRSARRCRREDRHGVYRGRRRDLGRQAGGKLAHARNAKRRRHARGRHHRPAPHVHQPGIPG